MAAIIIIFVFFFLVCKAVKTAARNDGQQQRGQPERGADPLAGKLATLEALQAQRDELNEQLEIINAALDAAPPEARRMKWMKERSRVYGQLATVESKISKLIG